MNLVDLHCDTITECYNQSKSLLQNDLHIDLLRATQSFEKVCQTFAIWIPDDKRAQAARDYFDAVYRCFLREVQKNDAKIAFCRSAEAITRAFACKKIAALLSVEGGAVLHGELSEIQTLADCGVRMLTLTWNGENELGYGCMCAQHGGLTDFGKACIPELEKSGILIDVSHLNREGFDDVAALSEKPFLATHSNCRIVDSFAAKKRNLTDEQIQCILRRGGIIGLNLCADFLGTNGDNGKDAVYRHTEHFLALGAQNGLCMGCDFDGCTVHEELSGIDRLYVLYDYLLSKNYAESLVQKIFFENAYRFFIANI